MKFRLILALVILATPVALSAQTRHSSDIGFWIVSPNMSGASFVDEGDSISIDFEEQTGYGISFNRYWTSAFSTELALQKYSAAMDLGIEGLGSFRAGDLDMTTLTATAQYHFLRQGRFSPYIGGGVAHINSDFEQNEEFFDPEDPEPVDFESEFTWTVVAGADIRVTESVSIAGEVKYMPWRPNEAGGTDENSIDVDPTTYSAGVRWRF